MAPRSARGVRSAYGPGHELLDNVTQVVVGRQSRVGAAGQLRWIEQRLLSEIGLHPGVEPGPESRGRRGRARHGAYEGASEFLRICHQRHGGGGRERRRDGHLDVAVASAARARSASSSRSIEAKSCGDSSAGCVPLPARCWRTSRAARSRRGIGAGPWATPSSRPAAQVEIVGTWFGRPLGDGSRLGSTACRYGLKELRHLARPSSGCVPSDGR